MPALAQALEDEERRVALVAENVEYYEEHPEFWDERYAEEQKAAEKESKSMIDFLRRAIESYTASRIASL
jgi:Mg-chelatase subunit ChlI